MARSWNSRLWPASAFQFFFIGGVAMLKPGANALTLSRYQSSALPWLYMVAALIAALLAVLGAEGRRRLNPGFLALAGGLISLCLAFGLWLEIPLMALGAYLFSEVFATQVSLSFWGAMGEAFDSREARKAFSNVSGVGMLGAIAGGLGAQLAARAAGALALLVVGAIFLMGATLAWRFHKADSEQSSPSRPPAPRAPWREVFAAPYTQLLGALVLGLALIQQLTDFVFRARASQLLEADMADLFAAHQLWTGVFCVVFQFSLAEVLLRRLGILKYAAAVPAILAALTVVAWVVPSVWSAFPLKVFEAASSWSLMPVIIQLIYAPLADRVRDGSRRTIDGLARKAGMIIAGLLILALANVVGLSGIFALSLLVCAGAGWALWKIRPKYIEAVHARVAGLEPTGAFEGEERLLSEALKTGSPEHALRAADILERTGLIAEVHVRQLLSHRQERVQERGVILAGSLNLTGVAKQLEAVIATGARRPRDGAIWALAKVAPERARQILPGLLGQSDVGILTAAAGGLLMLEGPEHAPARQVLEGLLRRGVDAPPAERREVARVLGRLARPEFAAPLITYLEDSDPSVRRVAIEAAGKGEHLELAPRLLRFLSWRDDRRGARDSLASLGDEVVPLIAAALDDRSRTRSLRLQLPRVLRLIGTQAAFDALLRSRALSDPSLDYRVVIALAQLHEEHPEFQVDEMRQLDALRERRHRSSAILEPYRDCRAALGEEALLTRILGDRLDQSMELGFWLLGLRRDPRGLRRAHTLLLGSDSRRRAWALELVDNEITPEERALISHHVETHHRTLPIGDAERLPRHLAALCDSEDFILRACARATARGEVGRSIHREDDMNETTVRRLFALEGVEIFARSDVDDVAAVAAVAKEQSFAKGARVYSEGDPGDALYVIVEGAMEARRDGEVVLRMKAKESFGETSLFDGAPRINEVIATMPSRTLVIDRRDFLDLLADRPELLAGMFRVLSRQLKSMVVEVANRRSSVDDLPALSAPPIR